MPLRLQAKLVIYGFVSFGDMLIIDDKGDPKYTDPHIFVDFGSNGRFQYKVANPVQNRKALYEREFRDVRRVNVFPAKYPEPSQGTVYEIGTLDLIPEAAKSFEYLRGSKTLYVFDKKLSMLSEGDLTRRHIHTTGMGRIQARGRRAEPSIISLTVVPPFGSLPFLSRVTLVLYRTRAPRRWKKQSGGARVR